MKALTTILAATLVCGSLASQGLESHKGSKPYMGRAFLFEADLERARQLGWLADDVSDDEALDGVAETLRTRLRGSGKFVEARVEREEDRRFSATFIGVQPEPYERFLEAGLTDPGQLALAAVVAADDAGVDLAAERARLEAWLAQHPDEGLQDFRLLPVDEGGPAPAIAWARRRHAPQDGLGFVPLRRSALWRFEPHDLRERPRTGYEPPFALKLSFNDPTANALAELSTPLVGREVAWLLNDEAVFVTRLGEPLGAEATLESGFTADEARVLLFATTAPLHVPLRFVGFDKRPLLGVADRGD